MKKKKYIVWCFSLKREKSFNSLTNAPIICQWEKALEPYLIGVLILFMYKIPKLLLVCPCHTKSIKWSS